MVRWVVGSIPHSGSIELFLVPTSGPRLVHIKELLLLVGKSSPCGDSGFPLSLSGIRSCRTSAKGK